MRRKGLSGGMDSARAATVVMVLVIAGCASSAPLRFYTLSAVPAAGAEVASGAAIRVGRVRIPAELDRMELVRRVDANRLSIGELDRWAAPMDDMIRRVLTADLQAHPGATSQGTSAAAGQSAATVNVDIEE